jgi:excisionase family DNA binding protein
MENFTMEQLALSVEAAASRVSMGRTFLFREIREGRLRAIKAGKSTRIRVPDLEAWLHSLPARVALPAKGKAA